MQNSIEAEISNLRNQINHHNDLYYQKSEHEIPDFEFDQLLERLKQLETEHPELITPRFADSTRGREGGQSVGFYAYGSADVAR